MNVKYIAHDILEHIPRSLNDYQSESMHSFNICTIFQIHEILKSFTNHSTFVAFLSLDSTNAITDDKHMNDLILQHKEICTLYENYLEEFSDKRDLYRINNEFVSEMKSSLNANKIAFSFPSKSLTNSNAHLLEQERINTEELECLKENTEIYHKSIMSHTLQILKYVKTTDVLQKWIANELSKYECTENESNWKSMLNAISAFCSMMKYCTSYNHTFAQSEKDKRHRLKTMIIKENSNLNELKLNFQIDRNSCKSEMKRLYDRLSSLKERISDINEKTQMDRNTEWKEHQQWSETQTQKWMSSQEEFVGKQFTEYSETFSVLKSESLLKEKTQIRRNFAKNAEICNNNLQFRNRIESQYNVYYDLCTKYEQNEQILKCLKTQFKEIEIHQKMQSEILQKKVWRMLFFCCAKLKIKLYQARKNIKRRQNAKKHSKTKKKKGKSKGKSKKKKKKKGKKKQKSKAKKTNRKKT